MRALKVQWHLEVVGLEQQLRELRLTERAKGFITHQMWVLRTKLRAKATAMYELRYKARVRARTEAELPAVEPVKAA